MASKKKSDAQEFQKAVDDLNATILKMSESFVAATASLNGAVDSVNARLDVLDKRIANMENQISSVGAKMDIFDRRITDMDLRTGTMLTDIWKAIKTFADSDRLTEIERRLSELERKVS